MSDPNPDVSLRRLLDEYRRALVVAEKTLSREIAENARLAAEASLLEAAWDDNERLRIQNARLGTENERLREELAALREGREAVVTHPETTVQ
jgi:hypothetical protein